MKCLFFPIVMYIRVKGIVEWMTGFLPLELIGSYGVGLNGGRPEFQFAVSSVVICERYLDSRGRGC